MMGRGRLFYVGGIDGSGKTTQAEAFVRAAASEDPRWAYRWARWEPRVTAALMWVARRALSRGTGRGAARPADDHGHRQFVLGKQRLFSRRWLRQVWTTIVLLEFLPQFWSRVGPALVRGRFVVCDRYLPDLWVDLAMNFGEGERGILRLQQHPLARCYPRPAGGVVLDVPPEVGHLRKQDGTPLAYLQDRRPLYLVLARLLPLRLIDADRPFAEVATEVRAALLQAAGLTAVAPPAPAGADHPLNSSAERTPRGAS